MFRKRIVQHQIRSGLRPLALESLEYRFARAGVVTVAPTIDITPEEQLTLELVNRARANPAAEAQRYGIDLNANLQTGQSISSESKPPLLPRNSLQMASRLHSTDMVLRDYFAHDALSTPQSVAPNGVSFVERVVSAGYTPYTALAENIAFASIQGTNLESAILQSHENLFRSAGHRFNMLSSSYIDVGIGIDRGQYSPPSLNGTSINALVTTQDFGVSATSPVAITGVAFQDSTINSDQQYSLGEGVQGMVIEARSSGGDVYRTTTGVSGGYVLPVPAGLYSLIARHDSNSYSIGNVTVGTSSVKANVDTSRLVPVSQYNLDANRDGSVSPIDVLVVINFLNRNSASQNGEPYQVELDINSNSQIEVVDVLIIINELNRLSEVEKVGLPPDSGGEGEDSTGPQTAMLGPEDYSNLIVGPFRWREKFARFGPLD